MNVIKKLFVKLLGKKIDGFLEKKGISKTKVIAVIGVLIYAIQTLAPQFGYEVKIPDSTFEILSALGLWTLRDAIKEKPPVAIVLEETPSKS